MCPARAVAFAFVSAFLASCATAPAACPSGTPPMMQYELFFGGSPGAADWQTFLDAEITPLFPQGFTVLDAYGQWRGAEGRITRENSKELLVIAASGPEVARRLEAVRAAYRTRFRQESVLLVEMPVCAAF